jgi:hypothetical protein
MCPSNSTRGSIGRNGLGFVRATRQPFDETVTNDNATIVNGARAGKFPFLVGWVGNGKEEFIQGTILIVSVSFYQPDRENSGIFLKDRRRTPAFHLAALAVMGQEVRGPDALSALSPSARGRLPSPLTLRVRPFQALSRVWLGRQWLSGARRLAFVFPRFTFFCADLRAAAVPRRRPTFGGRPAGRPWQG